MPTYDYVIAGAGLAGLSLACRLVRSPAGAGTIHIVDPSPAPLQGRLWSYWTGQPSIFDPIVCRRWHRLMVAYPTGSKVIILPDSWYEMVRGPDLNQFARQRLSEYSQVSFQTGTVDEILDSRQGARVMIDGQPVAAKWVFDSRHISAARRPPAGLAMKFRGWTIETQQEAFNPEAATFLDLRTPQAGAARFFYVLPVSARQAVVQYVIIAAAGLARPAAETALGDYLASIVGIGEYHIAAEEAGALALSAAIPPRRLGQHVMAIGARGGLVKPSTGFGFNRIQLDAAAIVRSLEVTGRPWNVPAVSRRHRGYDALLLDVLASHGHEAQEIFSALFTHNPIARVLRFLDETSTPAEDLELIATLPARPFLEALPRRIRAGLAF